MRLTVFFLLGAVVSAAFLNLTIFYISVPTRVTIAIIFMTFATGMILSMTQFLTEAAFGIFQLFNWRYRVERIHDSEVDQIAQALGAPVPKSINITDNPGITAVTNTLTRVITVSRRVTQQLTRRQLLAVLTHEIGHLKHRKMILAEFGLAMLATIGFSVYFLNIIILVSPIMGALAEWAFLLLIIIPILRYNEVWADAASKKVGLSDDLAEALGILSQGRPANDGSETHPATRSRISRLFTPTSPVVSGARGPSKGFFDRVADINWPINFTNPKRYRDNGVRDHILDYTKGKGVRSLTILDVGCSKGVAARTLKSDLEREGVDTHILGVDLSPKVAKKAAKNLDGFYQVDVLETGQEDLPLVDAVVCSYAAILVTGDRRANIIRRCAEQLKPDGILVTNALPFRLRRVETPWESLLYQAGALRTLQGGLRSFRTELKKRKADMRKRWSVAIIGREAALEFAESIRTSWENLSEKQRQAWKRVIFVRAWDFHMKRLLRFILRRLRGFAEVAY
jgi:Zn-dependent protease with chaperone function/SAM-dependent methyltransferase